MYACMSVMYVFIYLRTLLRCPPEHIQSKLHYEVQKKKDNKNNSSNNDHIQVEKLKKQAITKRIVTNVDKGINNAFG